MVEQMRADARRNYDVLLSVAAQCFAEQGTDASLRDVARKAGVGIGTLYRHFPTREALLEAVLGSRFDRLRDRADELAATAESPQRALRDWLAEFAAGSVTYRGLPDEVMAALHDGDSPLHASCTAMRAAGGRLVAHAQAAGTMRADITPDEALALAAGLAWAADHSPDRAKVAERLLSITMAGFEAVDPGQNRSAELPAPRA
jgi:AcrR family transcriptional regulator